MNINNSFNYAKIKVQDFAKIMEYKVMRTPALVINERLEPQSR